jgi:hypothetical protein
MISPPTTPTVVSRAGIGENTMVTVLLDCGNGNKVYRQLWLTVIDIPYDLIIGTNYFELFGFVLSGLPVKPPGPQVTATRCSTLD